MNLPRVVRRDEYIQAQDTAGIQLLCIYRTINMPLSSGYFCYVPHYANKKYRKAALVRI